MIYIANSNGDWWSTAGDQTMLYILDTQKLTKDQITQLSNEWGESDETLNGVFNHNKVDHIIWEYGNSMIINVGGSK